MLPELPYSMRRSKAVYEKFGGICHKHSAMNGDIYSETNISTEEYPIIRPRRKRSIMKSLSDCKGVFVLGANVFHIQGKTNYGNSDNDILFKNDTLIANLGTNFNGTIRRFTFVSDYVIILPDMAYYDMNTEEFGYMNIQTDVSWAGGDHDSFMIPLSISKFHKGEVISISVNGETYWREVTDVSANSSTSVTVSLSEPITVSGSAIVVATIKRVIPEMQYICEVNNRLWGCCEKSIYCSSLGNPFDFNRFNGLSTDSFSMNVISDGEFTGCCSFGSYPLFFMSNRIYRIYGTKPTTFQLSQWSEDGVDSGSSSSIAEISGVLFYLSGRGVMAYNGSYPSCIGDEIGVKLINGVAGTDGRRYVLCAKNIETFEKETYVYDTENGMWSREDDTEFYSFSRSGNNLYAACSEGIMALNPMNGTEEMVNSEVIFSDFTGIDGSSHSVNALKFGNKTPDRILFRLFVDNGAKVSFYLQYDDENEWKKAGEATGTGGHIFRMDLPLSRCDRFRLKITADGLYRLYALEIDYRVGSIKK